MRTRASGGARTLLWINGVLVVGLVALSLMGPVGGAGAQPVNQARPRGDYTMVSGKASTGNANAIYILDAMNQELVCVRWDSARRTMAAVGYRNLDSDTKAQPGR